jgi:hypothetical protein
MKGHSQTSKGEDRAHIRDYKELASVLSGLKADKCFWNLLIIRLKIILPCLKFVVFAN